MSIILAHITGGVGCCTGPAKKINKKHERGAGGGGGAGAVGNRSV